MLSPVILLYLFFRIFIKLKIGKIETQLFGHMVPQTENFILERKENINKTFIKSGGWHFSNIKNANDLELKLKSYLHHRDYEVEELGYNKINQLIKNNETVYDMFGDKRSKKYGDNKRKRLEKYFSKQSKMPF